MEQKLIRFHRQWVAVCLALVAGEGVGAGKPCDSISGGDATVATTVPAVCQGCQVADPALAADNDLSTYATLTVNGVLPGAGATIRATAQSGVVFPAGSRAGVLYKKPSAGKQLLALSLTTFLAGEAQESAGPFRAINVQYGAWDKPEFLGFTTALPFDALELSIDNNQLEGVPGFQVHEMCSDSDIGVLAPQAFYGKR